jgi:hypothetical protein
LRKKEKPAANLSKKSISVYKPLEEVIEQSPDKKSKIDEISQRLHSAQLRSPRGAARVKR